MDLEKEYSLLSNKMMLKQKRNLILNQTDKYMLSDFPISPEQLEEVKIYRQQLRNFTIDYIMPEKPSFVITIN
jgi:hypothetical protein